MKKANDFRVLILSTVILNIVSLTALYSSLHQGGTFVHQSIFYRQIAWIVIFWITLYIFSLINYRIYFDSSIVIYIISIILLIAVKLIGREIMGARRWFTFFGLNFQPSEFSKLAMVMLLARMLSNKNTAGSIIINKVALPFAATALSGALVFLQPDLGTAGIIFLLFFMMGFSSKEIKKRYLIAIIIAGLALVPLGWHHLRDYQKRRLTVFINPNVDPLGAGYTIIQSKIAIGSGRVTGKGFLSGTQNQFNFLPERHTDFIFTVIAEEFGLLGCLFLFIVYSVILIIIYRRIKRLKDSFAQFLSLGVYSILFFHIFINIGMTMGIIPVVGLPLIFISYGGTHLIITAIFLGIFLNIVRQN